MSRGQFATRADAERDCAAVTRALSEGFPVASPSGNPKARSAIRAAADALGVNRITLAHRIGTPTEPGSHFRQFALAPDWSIAAARGELGTRPVLPGYAIASTSTQRDGAGNVEREWVRQRRAPSVEPFKLPAGQAIKGVSALVDGQGREVAKWIKTDRERMSVAEMVASIREAFEDCPVRAAVAPAPPASDEKTATVYGLADLHLGLLTWRRETGEDWDLSIAKRVIGESVERLVAAAPPSREAVVLGLGDLLHANGYDNQTPKSKNPLDVDGRYPKILKAATYLMIAAIDAALTKHEHVTVRVLRGNHDREPAVAVALGLALHYAPHPRVTVDDNPDYFWWWRFGRVLLGATHGDMAKMAELPLIMAARNPEAWGASAFRYILTGHIHTRTAIEMSGVCVESLQTPIPPDAWHHESGYGATRSLTAITYHAEDGEVSRVKVNIRPSRDAA